MSARSTVAQVLVVISSSCDLMGDLGVLYLQLANTISQLLWVRPEIPHAYDCNCGVSIGVEACSFLVKEVLSHCVETSITTHTTSTTPSGRIPWNFSWLWLIILIFLAGCATGRAIHIVRRPRRTPPPVPAPIADSPGSRSNSSVRPRRGQAA